MSDGPILMTPQEAADYLGGDVTPRRLYLATRRGDLQAIKLAGRTGPTTYRRADLDAWLNGCAVSGGAR